MNDFAIKTLEYHLKLLITGLSAIDYNFYGYDELSDEGDLPGVKRPAVIVALPKQPFSIGAPRSPTVSQGYIERSEVTIYVETPLLITNPAGGSPSELPGSDAAHIPTCNAIRKWLKDNRGLDVPPSVTALGCTRDVFGMYPANPPEQPGDRKGHYVRLFHVIMQQQEAVQ